MVIVHQVYVRRTFGNGQNPEVTSNLPVNHVSFVP